MRNRVCLSLKEGSRRLQAQHSRARGQIKRQVLEAVLLPSKERRARQRRRVLQQKVQRLRGETNLLECLLMLGAHLIEQWIHDQITRN